MSDDHTKTIDKPAVHGKRSLAGVSIGQYLIRRLQDYGVRHVFGIPGDYVLTFYKMLSDSPIETIGCTRRRLCRFRRRCLRPGERHGRGLRHLLRRRVEFVQFDRRGLCREIAGGGHQRRAGFERANQ